MGHIHFMFKWILYNYTISLFPPNSHPPPSGLPACLPACQRHTPLDWNLNNKPSCPSSYVGTRCAEITAQGAVWTRAGSALISRFQRVYSSSSFHFTLICLHGEGQNSLPMKQLGVVAHICNLSTWEEDQGVQSQPWLHDLKGECMRWGVIGEGEMGDMETVFSGRAFASSVWGHELNSLLGEKPKPPDTPHHTHQVLSIQQMK